LQRIWHLLGWFVLFELSIIIFGVTSAPLLLALVVDTAAALLLVRSWIEMRGALPVNVPAAQRLGANIG
jgi:hypothetical protein